MSVGLYKYNGDIDDDNSEVIISEPIASQRIYDTYIVPAIEELNIFYFQDDAEIKFENLENVLIEIQLLIDWAQCKVEGEDKKYLSDRLIHIRDVIVNSLKTKDDILYIF